MLAGLGADFVDDGSGYVAQRSVAVLGDADQVLESGVLVDGVAVHDDADGLADGLPGLEGLGEIGDGHGLVKGDRGVDREQDCGVLGGVVECSGLAGVEVEPANRRAVAEDLDPHLGPDAQLDGSRGEPRRPPV
jgi:hypothetical protein